MNRSGAEQAPVRRLALRAAVALAAVVAVAAGAAVAVSSIGRGGGPTVPTPSKGGISGYLFQDRDGDGKRAAGEPLLGDWKVRVYSTGPLPLTEVRTRSDGTFSIRRVADVTPGERTVQLRVAPVAEGPVASGLPETTALSQSFTAALGERAVLPVSSLRLCPSADRCAGLDPPDLVPQTDVDGGGDEYPPPTATRVDTKTKPGRVLLRFATSTANLGGLLHVTALPASSGDDTQQIQQRMYGTNGVVIRDAGRFVYHPEHHHFHVEDFERYDLLSADRKEVLRTAGKVSFCLTDVLAADPPARPDGSLFLDLEPFDCGVTEQGINAGYADYYGRDLPGQWIDVTGLPSGRYWIRITADPQHHIAESDETNNAVSFPVDYRVP